MQGAGLGGDLHLQADEIGLGERLAVLGFFRALSRIFQTDGVHDAEAEERSLYLCLCFSTASPGPMANEQKWIR
jgi:hypothetical protein